MFATIINDCRDDNAVGRQKSRLASLGATGLSFVGVDSDLEAGLQLIDILDATEGRSGLILVNVAPRGGSASQFENGTPFAYFHYGDTLILASVEGYTLSAVKQLGLIDTVALLDTHSSAPALVAAGIVSKEAALRIPSTQFRSFDFTPRAGMYLFKGGTLPHERYDLANAPDLPKAIWHIDNFGNCKTTLRREDINIDTKNKTRFGEFPFLPQLKSVPDHTAAITEGSSGLGPTRFLELVIERGNFATVHQAKIGDDIFVETSHFRTATA
jgi:hypothetical protein